MKSVLAHYGIEDAEVRPVEIGLINETYQITTRDARFILQRLNPIFSAAVHHDIEAVTAHLAARGVVTPRLVPTQQGHLWVEEEGRVWRLQTFVEGTVEQRLESPNQAESAGALLGRFHRIVADLDHTFQNRRLGVHDTEKHIEALRRALAEHTGHARFAEVAPLLREVLTEAESLPVLPELPDRIVHGDPKISNVIFDHDGRAVAMIDLDTLAKMPVVLELGDAFRSWCNPKGEDADDVRFDLDLFEAAIRGYAGEGRLTFDEARSIVPATRVIIVELAVRFGADTLNESYFGWNAERFATRSHHNELRARGQLALARSLEARAEEAQAIVDEAFGRSLSTP